MEFTQYITPDGLVYNFDNTRDKFLISETGLGMPPIEYQTQRGPFQHGETVLDYRLRPRVIQLVHRRNACSRDEYYNDRSEFINYIRPNRQTVGTFSPGVFRKILPDGSRRDLKVFLEQGPEFAARSPDRWDEWSFHETIRFIAHDPIFYDPTPVSQVVNTYAPFGEWVFNPPFFDTNYYHNGLILPAPMGDIVTLGNSTTVLYTGTWPSYPTITLNGPMEGPIIENYSTGEKIQLNYVIAVGEVVTINLDYSIKSVTSSINGDITEVVADVTEFARFHLAPDPEVSGGNNVILFSATSVIPNLFVEASTDDAEANSTDSTIDLTAIDLNFGNDGAHVLNIGARFTLDVPKNATIISAYLALCSIPALPYTNSCKAKIYCDDADDSATFSTYANFAGRSLTTAFTSWTLPDTNGVVVYHTPSIVTAIQEVVNRAGWAFGNHCSVILRDDSSTAGATRNFKSWDNLYQPPPRLYVNYAPTKSTASMSWYKKYIGI